MDRISKLIYSRHNANRLIQAGFENYFVHVDNDRMVWKFYISKSDEDKFYQIINN